MSFVKNLVAASLVVALPATAGIESLEVKGEGPNRSSAIQAALVSAMQQVVGVSVSSESISSDHFKNSNDGFEFNKQNLNNVSFGTAGNATYRILSENCSEGECVVRLRANVEYDDDVARQKKLKGMNSNRRTLAFEPFTGSSHGKSFAKEIESRFVQDRRFSVVADRTKPGVDYVLKGKVIEAATQQSTNDTRRVIELTGEQVGSVTTSYRSRFIVEYELIDVINNQIKWSAKVPTTSSRDNLPYLIELSSRKVFDALKDNIYPMVLIAAGNGQLVLNSGGQTVQQGEYYDIFAVGEELIDPYSKESLGFTEDKVGQVRVIKVQHKVSYVEVVTGQPDDMLDMPYARRAAPPQAKTTAVATKPAPKEKKIERTSGIVF